MTLNEMSFLLANVYHRSARAEVTVNGFHKTEIVPFNRFAFADTDFAPSLALALASTAVDPAEAAPSIEPDPGSRLLNEAIATTSKRDTTFSSFPDPDDEGPFYGFGPPVPGTASFTKTKVQKTEPQEINPTKTTCETEALELSSTTVSVLTKTKEGCFNVSPFSIRPLPKSSQEDNVYEKNGKASILTLSPNREVLKALHANRFSATKEESEGSKTMRMSRRTLFVAYVGVSLVRSSRAKGGTNAIVAILEFMAAMEIFAHVYAKVVLYD